ncbi:ABC-type Fe3+/spermidine/putrescine transport system ATPase subunit [Deinococcus metalli]|uniref:ABC-type Fe3+/spermidine/putrescine transport system ATPase subunit n=1 Tax=Deinococcus metalli TaxID=1141878 RepID=A0A7W8KJD0_9DEIO|nr:ABC transporter ATP-binding protein [Deinococcus metalli]MBB5379217.1 ABC-type Fe3+/spermidine/putrescine transport system ATPase subunit [Deinococcus metalli]GHF65500.1 iron ABC transporter ATP-binding protein [Deinococcus metalli]
MTRLELRAVRRTYPGGLEVLRGIDLDIHSGERFVLLGASGSGKSTLLRVIAGLDAPDAGDVYLDGQSMTGVPAERRDLGLVFQQPLLFPHLSVEGNLRFGLRHRKLPEVEVTARVADMLVRTGLDGLGPRRPNQLSGGQEGRVALARALITRPRALLLDEPLSALDAPLRRELREWIVTLQRATGTTLLLVTHDQEEALAVAQRIGFLHGGHLQQVGTPQEIYARPATVDVARFFGALNIVPGQQEGLLVNTVLGCIHAARPGHGSVSVTIRPEAWQPGPAAVNTVEGVIRSTTFGGAHWTYVLDACGLPLVWHAPTSVHLQPGDPLTLHAPPDACWPVATDVQ